MASASIPASSSYHISLNYNYNLGDEIKPFLPDFSFGGDVYQNDRNWIKSEDHVLLIVYQIHRSSQCHRKQTHPQAGITDLSVW